jgi:hypothetical protein
MYWFWKDRRKRYLPNMLTGTAYSCIAWQQQEQQQQQSTTSLPRKNLPMLFSAIVFVLISVTTSNNKVYDDLRCT